MFNRKRLVCCSLNEKVSNNIGHGIVVMLGVIILLYLILSHLFYNSFKDCLKVYLNNPVSLDYLFHDIDQRECARNSTELRIADEVS